ncbi:MAG: aminotransferase class I/II-fold pyridoxal phosphate-dependent enzyme [SAR202 cluster bacterium]|nr:1-aminocyclopropane-1-carboxylate deaminase [Chloroflexota bacterium]MQG51187.1 aminotransferase class I/II-fold pyridoxal phosphate-dependent enzyme [SAR202 cluster bacterium]|tara:strand:- start:12000 stop:13151 length:1152 start_codon:yes stop_codon:yes gene_type:complete
MKNSKRGNVDPFIVMDVMEAARKAEESGRRIIHMEVGQPGTAAPKQATNSVIESMTNNNLGYTVALGLPELRMRISQLYGEWYNVDINPNRIAITPGSSSAFVASFTSLFDSGDRVGIAAPGYPSYKQILKALDLVPVTIRTIIENRFQPLPEDLPNNDLSGFLIASPANPTGSMLDYQSLSDLIHISQENNISFISDEIYHGIEYETKAVTALEITDDCYVINSFSKYFSMTGWRIGWIIVPENHIRQIESIVQNMFICAPHVSQIAAIAAMDAKDELEYNMSVYRKNRSLMIEGLAKAGFTEIAPPDGAFYIYANISKFSNNSFKFTREILDEAGIAITPGFDFDAERGNETIRFSYAGTTDDMKEGLNRLYKYMKSKDFI